MWSGTIMNIKRLTFFGVGFLLIFGLALATTYLCLEHFVFSRRAEIHNGTVNALAWSRTIRMTKEQDQRLKPLEASLKKDLKGLQLKLAQERMALCSLLRDGSTDSKELDGYVARVAALESQQQRCVIQHLVAIREILTLEQKNQFFNAIMQDICQGCRTTIGDDGDLCGMCALPHRRSQ